MKSTLRNVPTRLLTVAVLALSASTFAAPPPDPNPANSPTYPSTQSTDTANSMDANKSGDQTAQAKFDELDVNHDGYIDKQEAMASKTLSAEFKKLDADKDGKLSLAEFFSASDMAKIRIDRKSEQQ